MYIYIYIYIYIPNRNKVNKLNLDAKKQIADKLSISDKVDRL